MNAQLFHHAANAVGLLAFCAPVSAEATRADNVDNVVIDWNGDAGTSAQNALMSRVSMVPRLAKTQPQLDDLRRSFAQIRSLDDGWAGENSLRPNEAVVRAAARHLDQALNGCQRAARPAIVPVADGGVQAEWYLANSRFEIYFEPDGDILAWSEDRASGAEFEAEGTAAIQLLVDWVARLDSEARSAA